MIPDLSQSRVSAYNCMYVADGLALFYYICWMQDNAEGFQKTLCLLIVFRIYQENVENTLNIKCLHGRQIVVSLT